MAKQNNIAIIDYEMGNLFSVQHACRYVGLNPVITTEKNDLLNVDAAILPGVGAFGTAMDNLKRLDLISPIKDFIDSGKPFMGICLGLQLLFSESEEFGSHKGLNIINGVVKKFPSHNNSGNEIKVPQIGWNRIEAYPFCPTAWSDTPLKDIKNNTYMYFVHSYYIDPLDKSNILTLTNYEGTEYASSIFYNNIFASQFHPEKSATEGLKIYKNWAQEIIIKQGLINER